MHIKDLNIVTEKVTDNRGTYWIARGESEHGPVLCYGPTRAEAFQYACTAIKEQGQRKYLDNFQAADHVFDIKDATCVRPSPAQHERMMEQIKQSGLKWSPKEMRLVKK